MDYNGTTDVGNQTWSNSDERAILLRGNPNTDFVHWILSSTMVWKLVVTASKHK